MSTVAVETERVNFRANKAAKREAERVMHAMGLNLSDGLNIFLARVAAEHRVPFALAMTTDEVLAPQTAQLASAAVDSIRKAVAHRVADGSPVARYDQASRRAFIEYPDGRREYIDA